MAYCRKCRTRIDDEAVICPHCGVPQQISAVNQNSSSSSVGSSGQSSNGSASSFFLIFMSVALIILGLLGLVAAPKGLLLSIPCFLGAAAMIASLVKRKKEHQQMVENMSRAAANNSAPVTQTSAPAKKSNAQAIIGIVAVLIIALGFASYYFNIFGPKGEELAIKCYNDYTEQVVESKKNSSISYSYSSPRVLSNTNNVYYIYAVVTSKMYGVTAKTGGITVLRIDSEARQRYTVLSDIPISADFDGKEPSEEQIQNGLKAAKMIWDSKASNG